MATKTSKFVYLRTYNNGIFKVSHKGNFKKTDRFFNKMSNLFRTELFTKYGIRGVELLREATPKNTGKTSESWVYELVYAPGGYVAGVRWRNTNIVHTKRGNVSVAMLIQYGHGTRRHKYVQGRDYINPVMEEIFNELAEAIDKEITS